MQIFNLDSLKTFPYDERDKNVFFKVEEFKTRVIRLLPGENIPECEMASYVIFIVLEGEAEITVNTDKASLVKNQCLITEPSIISMQSKNGVKIIGIQIVKNLNYSFSFNLNTKERLELEIIVLDKDKRSALNFMRKYNFILNEAESLEYCTEWLKKIKKGEQEKLKIKFTDKGPRINI